MYRQCPFLLGALVISHIKGNSDIFVVPLLHNFPNAYIRLVCYPFVILTFLTLGKILLEIFHLLLQNSTQECEYPLLLPFSLNLAKILIFCYFSTVTQLFKLTLQVDQSNNFRVIRFYLCLGLKYTQSLCLNLNPK